MPRWPRPALETEGPEVCVCAAIRLKNGKVITGRRDGEILVNAFFLGFDHRGSTQGFMTSKGRFVTRTEGRKLQDAAGIPSRAKDGYRGDKLYSEDLY